MGMDVEYLKKSVGKCLADGLAEIADRQPVDPINFLAHWIHNYKETINQEEKNRAKEQDVKMPEEYEAILKEEVLEDNQGELNTIRNKLDEIRD